MTYISKNPALVWLDSLGSKVSIKNYKSSLNTLCRYMNNDNIQTYPWNELDYTKVIELRRFIYDKDLTTGTINTYLSIIKSVTKEAWRLNQLTTDCYLKIKDVKRAKGESKLTGRALNIKELKKLLSYGDKSNNPKTLRDSAMLALAYGGGLRRSEVVSLNKNDYHREFIYVTGKGKTERKVYLPKETTQLIERFLLSIDDCSVLFPRMYSGGKTKNQRLRPDALIKIINIRCDNTKIKRFTPHDLRRSFATNLINSNVDLFTVQQLMRHKSLETTQRYDMRSEHVKKEAIKKLPF